MSVVTDFVSKASLIVSSCHLVRLGEAVKAARGGHELSSKLHSTAVNVLSGKAHTLQGRWEKVSPNSLA